MKAIKEKIARTYKYESFIEGFEMKDGEYIYRKSTLTLGTEFQ